MSGWSSRLFTSFALCSGMSAVALGCAPAVPSFPPLDVDAGIQCDDETPCGAGETCLQSICYAACDATHPCGPREACSSGVCILRAGDAGTARDVGAPDAPPDAFVDPCVAAACTSPTPICRAGLCVECETATDCGGSMPICDLGRGACVAFAPDYCAPCNSDLDCRTGTGTVLGRCIARAAPEPSERVCLPTCSATVACPSGFRCDLARELCTPTVESCTGYYAGATSRACTTEAGCAQIGATVDTGLVTGSCSDDGGGNVCHYACGLPGDCPTGFSCTGGFCRRT